MFGEHSSERYCLHPVGLFGEADQHEEQNVEHFEACRVQLRSYAQSDANMLVFDAFEES